MLIARHKQPPLPLPGRLHRHRRKIQIGLLVMACSTLLVVLGAVLQKNGFYGDAVKPYLVGSWKWPINALTALAADPDKLVIDMKWVALQKLERQRTQALEDSILLAGSDDLVPAAFTVDGKTVKVRMRLKGDSLEHLRGHKWSFRVKVRGKQTIWGMKQFSLHHPQTRNWMFAWLAHRAMRREGVIALRYKFVDVTLNGKHLGIYALEEHFEKRLIENNARREGPIVRFSEDLMWREMARQSRVFPGAATNGAGSYVASEPDGFQTQKALSEPRSRADYVQAVQLLDRFRRGKLATGKVFDLGKLAAYFALIDLFGGEHGARWHNIRFYYNPVISRLEPIAFDLNAGQLSRVLSIGRAVRSAPDRQLFTDAEQFSRMLFSDMEFCARYIAELERIADPAYLVRLLDELADEMDAARKILHLGYPFYEFTPEILRRNQQYIRTALNPVKGLHAFINSKEAGQITIKAGNIQRLPIVVTGVELIDGRLLELPQPLVLASRPYDQVVDYQVLPIDLPSGEQSLQTEPPEAATVVYRLLGTSAVRRAPLTAYPYSSADPLVPDMVRRPPNVDRFPFLVVNQEAKTIWIQRGQWQVREDIIIPPGYSVSCGPGTEIDLIQSAMILSRSPLKFSGSEDEPIVVRSSDGTGQGLAVLQARAPSLLEHVWFDGLTNPNRPSWELTGAVTFYESPLTLLDCRLSNNASEDGLNLIRSEFRIERCTFSDTKSDAIDVDFCEGTIRSTTIVRCGNDGIDLSGSVVKLEDVSVLHAGDKAISVGEASHVIANRLTINEARIGLASKDLSEFLISDVALTGCRFGLVAFQKKSEFGPGTLRVERLTSNRVAHPFLVEDGSIVTLDGRVAPAAVAGVMELLYPTPNSAPRKPKD